MIYTNCQVIAEISVTDIIFRLNIKKKDAAGTITRGIRYMIIRFPYRRRWSSA